MSLQLRGPLTRTLDSNNPPEVLLDLADARPGINSYPINESDIPLPAEVDVVSVDPSAITLELERQESRLVLVRPVIDGVPAEGFVLGEILIVPTHYTIQGPESRLLALEFVETNQISIEGATAPVDAVVQPLIPDPLLRALGIGQIQITVDIVPEALPEDETAAVDEG